MKKDNIINILGALSFLVAAAALSGFIESDEGGYFAVGFLTLVCIYVYYQLLIQKQKNKKWKKY